MREIPGFAAAAILALLGAGLDVFGVESPEAAYGLWSFAGLLALGTVAIWPPTRRALHVPAWVPGGGRSGGGGTITVTAVGTGAGEDHIWVGEDDQRIGSFYVKVDFSIWSVSPQPIRIKDMCVRIFNVRSRLKWLSKRQLLATVPIDRLDGTPDDMQRRLQRGLEPASPPWSGEATFGWIGGPSDRGLEHRGRLEFEFVVEIGSPPQVVRVPLSPPAVA